MLDESRKRQAMQIQIFQNASRAHRADGCGGDRGTTLVKERWLAAGKTTYHPLSCGLVRVSLVGYLSGRWRQEGGQKGKRKNIFKMPEPFFV